MKESGPGKTLRALFDEIRDDKEVKFAVNEAETFMRRKLSASYLDGIISYAKQVRVPVDQINEKMVESINISGEFVASTSPSPPWYRLADQADSCHKAWVMGGAVRKDKQIKIDFFLLHCFTTSIFLTTFMAQDWITPENKARFLEWKIRFDLFWYAVSGSPPVLVDEIKNYVPKNSLGGNPWLDIIERSLCVQDDGHTIKVIRALVNGERLTAKYRDISKRMDLPVVSDMWLKIAAMCQYSWIQPIVSR